MHVIILTLHVNNFLANRAMMRWLIANIAVIGLLTILGCWFMYSTETLHINRWKLEKKLQAN